jgi:hypothetical protein
VKPNAFNPLVMPQLRKSGKESRSRITYLRLKSDGENADICKDFGATDIDYIGPGKFLGAG